MNQKRNIVCLMLLVVLCPLRAQEARTCFVNMPDSLNLLLTAVNRADFVDFLDSGMKAEVTNRLGGKSEMTTLTPDYIHVRMTEKSSWEMKMLPVNDSTKVICTVSTVCAPVCDSHIRFYTTGWKELPTADYLPSLPGQADFIGARPDTIDVYEYEKVCRQADLLLVKMSLSAEEPVLCFSYTTPDYMEKEAAEKLKSFLHRPIIRYVWRHASFVVQ